MAKPVQKLIAQEAPVAAPAPVAPAVAPVVETPEERKARAEREARAKLVAARDAFFADLPDLHITLTTADGQPITDEDIEVRHFSSHKLGYGLYGKADIPGTDHRLQMTVNLTVVKSAPEDER